MLKALILNSTPEKEHDSIEAEFRGQRAHQYEWLRHRYAQTGAPALPPEVSQSLAFVNTWETSLRYTPGLGHYKDASRFLTETRKLIDWADSRI